MAVPFWGAFSDSFWAGPKCSKCSTGYIQTTFRPLQKRSLFGSMLSSFSVHLGSIVVLFGSSGPFQNKLQKMPSKKTAPKPKMSQNGSFWLAPSCFFEKKVCHETGHVQVFGPKTSLSGTEFIGFARGPPKPNFQNPFNNKSKPIF